MNQQKRFRISSNLIVLAAFAVLAISLVWNTTEAIYRNYDLQQQVNELEAELEVMELRNQNLAFDVAYYNTETFLELEAREKFNKIKPGEKIVLLEKNTEPEIDNSSSSNSEVDQSSNKQLWFDFLMGRVAGGS